MPFRQLFLSDERMGLAVTQVARRRADQLRNLMGVLKLAAVNFDYPNKISAAASTMRVFPDPVGPRNKKLPTGRPGEFKPA